MWRDLKSDPIPLNVEDAVILFPLITDCGILYTLSNPQYARLRAVQAGYTHWMEFLKHPDHDAVDLKRIGES